jgi:hypothetical protein
VSALDDLRENLREAARRDIEARSVRRRRQRRGTALLAALLLGGAAAAGAADLISVGEPATDLRVQKGDYKPPPGTLRPKILARADSDGLRLPYGVGEYVANNGKQCLVVGSLLGYTLGRIDHDKFKPYKQDTVGSCNAPGKPLSDLITDHGRTLVIGRAPPDRLTATVTIDGKPTVARLAAGRVFLLVFKGEYPRAKVRVSFTR